MNRNLLTISNLGIIAALLLSFFTLSGLKERWGLDILGKQQIEEPTATLVTSVLEPQDRVLIRGFDRIVGLINSFDLSSRKIILDPSFGLSNDRLVSVTFSEDTHFWKAAIHNIPFSGLTDETPPLSPENLPLLYYRQPYSVEQIRKGAILMVEVREWVRFTPPALEIVAESAGIFDKVPPETKKVLRLRYGPVAEKIESY